MSPRCSQSSDRLEPSSWKKIEIFIEKGIEMTSHHWGLISPPLPTAAPMLFEKYSLKERIQARTFRMNWTKESIPTSSQTGVQHFWLQILLGGIVRFTYFSFLSSSFLYSGSALKGVSFKRSQVSARGSCFRRLRASFAKQNLTISPRTSPAPLHPRQPVHLVLAKYSFWVQRENTRNEFAGFLKISRRVHMGNPNANKKHMI